MSRIGAYLVLLLAAAAQGQDVNDLENEIDYGFDPEDVRMVGGEIVQDSTYSFVVAIQPKFTDRNNLEQRAVLCSGVLIQGTQRTTSTAAYYVLTSASCALSGTSYDLYAGINRVTPITAVSESITNSSSVLVTEEFRRTMSTGDLAIIPVSSITPNSNITTARLTNVNDVNRAYLVNTVTMAGWGYPNDVYLQNSPTIRRLSSWIVPNWYCAVRHISMPIRSEHLCTAGLVNRGPCTGDSGAPLILQSTSSSGTNQGTTTRVIGLVTQTPRDGCSRGRPGIFTRIGAYLDWIRDQTGYDVEQ